MSINGANGYANQFPANNYGGSFNRTPNFGGGYMVAPQPKPMPQPKNDLWCLPVQNFRVDGGSTNLYSQKVSIDWPEFRPQNPIFSGPRVQQDTTNIYANPGANFNFDDCGYGNFSGGFIGGGFPGMGGGFPNMGGMGGYGGGAKGGMGMGGGFPNMGGGFPNMGALNMGGFPSMGFPNMGGGAKGGFPDFFGFPLAGGLKDPKGGVDGGVKDGGKTSLSGKGSIDGLNFKSGDGERYELKVEAGKSYNLLSDAGIGLNGTYGKDSSGETVLTDIALSVGGKIVTLADDGTLRVDGKAFDKKKNNLEGLVTENKNGTYTVKANGYEFELKASENGIKVKIDAKNARTPEGLWGVALDGDKQTERELQKSIKESDYKIDDALTFDYEDNNNIGEKYMPNLDDDEKNDLAWNSRNPAFSGTYNTRISMNNSDLGTTNQFGTHGPQGTSDDANWKMSQLAANKFYDVFSDEDIQVNGRFANGIPQEMGFTVDGDAVQVEQTSSGLKVTVNGDVVTSYNNGGITLANNQLTIKPDSDEQWTFTVKTGTGGLDFRGEALNVGANGTRSTGLLGDTIRPSLTDNGNDNNGAGYLRNADGSLSKAGQDMSKALREYLVDDWDDTSSGRSVYE